MFANYKGHIANCYKAEPRTKVKWLYATTDKSGKYRQNSGKAKKS